MKNQPNPDQQPTVENLAKEMQKRFFLAEVCKGFVAVKFTPQAQTISRTALVGIDAWFSKRTVIVNQTDKGFYITFSE